MGRVFWESINKLAMHYGSFQIGTMAGIPIRIHWSFLLLIAYIGYTGYVQQIPSETLFWYSIFVFFVFLSVGWHELGHAFAARFYGIQTDSIILSPIGGAALLNGLPTQPLQEAMVAFAGPLANFLLAGLIALYLQSMTTEGVHLIGVEEGLFSLHLNFLPSLFWANVALGTVNMLPAFPMDGGRVFRALLLLRWSRGDATRVAVIFGQTFAILGMVYGLSNKDYTTTLIAVLVFSGAWSEYKKVIFKK
jgi:Zn-dependent protease